MSANKNELTLRVNLKNHFLQSWCILVYFVFFILVSPWIFVYAFGSESLNFALKFSLCAFLLILIPTVAFHIRYWYLSRSVQVTFFRRKKAVIYEVKGESTEFTLDDILKIDTIVSKAKFNKDLRAYPWDSFCFSKIYLKTGEVLLVTSLVIPELFWPLKLPRENIKSAYFCWL